MRRREATADVRPLILIGLASFAIGIAAQTPDSNAAGVTVIPVQGNVYAIASGGVNMAMQVGDDGVVLVDTHVGELSEKIYSAIRSITPKPIIAIVNTHLHLDHMGGNDFFRNVDAAAMGVPIPIYAHDNIQLRAVEPEPVGLSDTLWPTFTYSMPDYELYRNGEGIRLIHQRSAHTDGDSLVHFRSSDVIVAGDVYSNVGFPVFDRSRGGSYDGIIEALTRLLHVAIAGHAGEGGTLVVPGHGRIADEADLVEYRDMLLIIRDRVRHLLEEGKSLNETIAARPAFEYETRYGDGHWTTDVFVEEVYRDMAGGQTAREAPTGG